MAKLCLTLATLRTVARQALLPMGFPRQEYWSGFSFPSAGDLPDPGMEPGSPAFIGGFFTNWVTKEFLIFFLIHMYFFSHLYSTDLCVCVAFDKRSSKKDIQFEVLCFRKTFFFSTSLAFQSLGRSSLLSMGRDTMIGWPWVTWLFFWTNKKYLWLSDTNNTIWIVYKRREKIFWIKHYINAWMSF